MNQAYRLEFTNIAKKDIQAIDKANQKRIAKKLKFFLIDPLVYATKLERPYDGQYRWRVGFYRIVFDIEGDVVTILRVQHRKEIYR